MTRAMHSDSTAFAMRACASPNCQRSLTLWSVEERLEPAFWHISWLRLQRAETAHKQFDATILEEGAGFVGRLAKSSSLSARRAGRAPADIGGAPLTSSGAPFSERPIPTASSRAHCSNGKDCAALFFR